MKFVKYFRQLLEKVDLLNTKTSDFDKNVVKRGAKVEKEHTSNKNQAKIIAKQHMAEFPKKKDGKISSDYYDKLDVMEKDLDKKKKTTFKKLVDDVVKENTMAGGAGSMFGANAGDGSTWNNGQSGDTYATGDARNLFG